MLIDMCCFQAEVEETLYRLQSMEGVQGVIIVNSQGRSQTQAGSVEMSKGYLNTTGGVKKRA